MSKYQMELEEDYVLDQEDYVLHDYISVEMIHIWVVSRTFFVVAIHLTGNHSTNGYLIVFHFVVRKLSYVLELYYKKRNKTKVWKKIAVKFFFYFKLFRRTFSPLCLFHEIAIVETFFLLCSLLR